eukprot:2087709-Rhodomonas_salina.3
MTQRGRRRRVLQRPTLPCARKHVPTPRYTRRGRIAFDLTTSASPNQRRCPSTSVQFVPARWRIVFDLTDTYPRQPIAPPLSSSTSPSAPGTAIPYLSTAR